MINHRLGRHLEENETMRIPYLSEKLQHLYAKIVEWH